KFLAIGYQDGNIGTWDIATGKLRKTFLWNAPPEAKDKDPKPAGDVKGVMVPYIGPVNVLVFSPNGKSLLARCPDNVLRLYDAAEAKKLQEFGEPNNRRQPNQEKFVNPIYNVGSFGFSAEGKSVISAGYEFDRAKRPQMQTLLLKNWDVATGKEQE